MSDELTICEDEANQIIDEIKEMIESTKPKRGKTRIDAIDEIRRRIRNAEDAIKAFNVELRGLTDLRNDPQYKTKQKNFTDTINKFKVDVEFLEKDELTEGAGRKNVNSMSVDEKLNLANEMQQDDIRRLEEANRLVEESKDIGISTIDKLTVQNEKLDNARADVGKINSEMDIAARELRIFSKKIMTDKIILAVLFLIVIAIACVIVFIIVKPHAKKVIEKF